MKWTPALLAAAALFLLIDIRPAARVSAAAEPAKKQPIIYLPLVFAAGQAAEPTATATSTQPAAVTATVTVQPTEGVQPTDTATATLVPPTPTHTSIPPTPTFTSTALPPTPTFTSTALPPTATFTSTALPPTATNTPVPPTATRTPTTGPTAEPGSQPISDDFNTSGSPNSAVWRVIRPLPASSSLRWTGTQVEVYLSSAAEHDLWDSQATPPGLGAAVRLEQSISNVDFDVSVKFDSDLYGTYTAQGLLIQQDSKNLIQYYFYSYLDPRISDPAKQNRLAIFASKVVNGVEGSANYIYDEFLPFTKAPMLLRVQRQGNVFHLYYSIDDVNWTRIASPNVPLQVRSIGIAIANEDNKQPGAQIPSLSARIDHFENRNAPLAQKD